MNTSLRNSLALFPLLVAACGGDFEPGSTIERQRVLGARVEVAGEPARSWAKPEETANVTFVIANPAGAPPVVEWAIGAFHPGSPSAPFAMFTGGGAPSLNLEIPSAAVLGSAAHVSLLGVVCENGTPVLDGDLPACEGDAARATRLLLTVPLQRGTVTNHNPEIESASLSLDGSPWTAGECRTVKAGAGAIFTIDPTGVERETVDDKLEPLQFSTFVTGGELARQFTFIEPHEASTPFDVEWTAPKEPGVVLFHAVVRDLRGGFDAGTFSICVTP